MRKTAFAALLAAGFFTVAPITHADAAASALGVDQILEDMNSSAAICGDAIVLGSFGSLCEGGGATAADRSGDRDATGSGDVHALGGNQAATGADAPVNVCGNAVGGVLGSVGTACSDINVSGTDDDDDEPSGECDGRDRGCGGEDRPEEPPNQGGEKPGGGDDKEGSEDPGDRSDLPRPPADAPADPEERTGTESSGITTPVLPLTGAETTTLVSGGIVAIVLGMVALYIGYSHRGRKDGPTL
ncbi:hypothetical protein [Actinorugispora endophytica]|nr:hypothetical protein [Actinorugispora endophytica]